MENAKYILYVDDEVENLTSFAAAFRRDFTIFTANCADQALQIMKNQVIHIIISDQ
jgi:DNA-binding NtrC family response regulator